MQGKTVQKLVYMFILLIFILGLSTPSGISAADPTGAVAAGLQQGETTENKQESGKREGSSPASAATGKSIAFHSVKDMHADLSNTIFVDIHRGFLSENQSTTLGMLVNQAARLGVYLIDYEANDLAETIFPEAMFSPGYYEAVIDSSIGEGIYYAVAAEDVNNLPDGVYDVSNFLTVKTSSPQLEFVGLQSVYPSYAFTVDVAIEDSFVQFAQYEDTPYDVDFVLSASYTLSEQSGRVVETGSNLSISEDGIMHLPFGGLDEGAYALEVTVRDYLGHTVKKTAEFSVEADSFPDIDDFISDAYLDSGVVSDQKDTTNMVIEVKPDTIPRDSVYLGAVEVHDLLDSGKPLGVLLDGSLLGVALEPGVNTVGFNTRYCPVEFYDDPTACTNYDYRVPDGLYSLSVPLNSFGTNLGVLDIGPYMVKSGKPQIIFSGTSGETISGKVRDDIITWATQVPSLYTYDVNDYFTVNYAVKNDAGQEVKHGATTMKQDGTFAVTLAGLPAGTYSVEMTVNDVLGNTVKAESETFSHIERIAGSSRYSTAIEVSQRGWNTADTVILARGDDFSDALAGVPLAHKLNAPILMTVSDRLLDNTLAEMKRLGAEHVVILGGEVAIRESVADALREAGLKVRRISGASRFETAALIASEVSPDGSESVVVANGMDFPDALSVASSAAREGLPILLTLANRIPVSTDAKLKELGVSETIVVGGPKVVSENVAGQLPGSIRLDGADRYGTNIAIAEYFGVESKDLYVATGQHYADALTGAVLAAKHKSTILLVHHRVPAVAEAYLRKHRPESLAIFGGIEAVSSDVEDQLRELLR